MGRRSRTVAQRRAQTKTAQVLVETRIYRKRLSTFLVKIAALLGSKSLAVRAIRLVRVEYRVDRGSWKPVPPDDVLRILTNSTR